VKLTAAPVSFSRNEVIYSENRPADYVYNQRIRTHLHGSQ